MKICNGVENKKDWHKEEGKIFEITTGISKGTLVMVCQIAPAEHRLIAIKTGNRIHDININDYTQTYVDVTDQYCLQKVK